MCPSVACLILLCGSGVSWGAGDVDQLPPVGPGRVLSDAIQSGVIPGVDLRQVFRQAQQSNIVRTAHAVNRGDLQALPLSLPLLSLADVQVCRHTPNACSSGRLLTAKSDYIVPSIQCDSLCNMDKYCSQYTYVVFVVSFLGQVWQAVLPVLCYRQNNIASRQICCFWKKPVSSLLMAGGGSQGSWRLRTSADCTM